MFGDKSHINDLTYGIGTKCGCTDRRRSNSESKIVALLSSRWVPLTPSDAH
jgi:hypothetical protein